MNDSEKINNIKEYLKQNEKEIADGTLSAIGISMAIEFILGL